MAVALVSRGSSTPTAGASSSAAACSSPPSTVLAPGFRFHPTDEELVSYYLKRKVRGRPFCFDAIAEVDLYKLEPWDLPAHSRMRSRDQEWYFFSPLDRRYSNLSRINRATPAGYWKTTGKDRPVVRRLNSAVVGVKKTLVFHSGRAPNGQRTNWVMHEYRLEDEELPREGIPQDTYVVCRIFQKKGIGSQNGAQYGAPFVEEEWEGSDEMILKKVREDDEVIGSKAQNYLQLDVIQKDLGIQHEAGLLLAWSNGRGDGGHPEDSSVLDNNLERSLCRVHEHVGIHEQQADLYLFDGIGETTSMACQVELSDKPQSQSDEILQHHDIAVSVESENHSKSNSVTCPDMPFNGQETGNEMYGSGSLPDIYNFDELLTAADKFVVDDYVCQSAYHQMCLAGQNDICLHHKDHPSSISAGCYTGQIVEESKFSYDASSSNLPQENIKQINGMLEPPVVNSCGFNMLTDLMEYYEATNDKLYYADVTSLVKLENIKFSESDSSNLLLENNDGNMPISLTSQQDLGTNVEHGMVSAENVLQTGNPLSGVNEDVNLASDAHENEVGDSPLMRHLTGILNSFSAPPAFAAEFPPTAARPTTQDCSNHLTRLVNDTSMMVQVSDLTVKRIAKDLSLQKKLAADFLLSGGMNKKNVARNSRNNKQKTNLHVRMVLTVLRVAFYLVFLLALIFTLSLKIGICICTR